VVRAGDARKKGAPVVHDIAPDNTCYVWGLGDKAAVDKAFSGAAHVTTLEFLNTGSSQRNRAARGERDLFARGRKLHALRREPEPARRAAADDRVVLGLPEHKVRVVAPTSRRLRLEDLSVRRGRVCTWASKQVNRPVKWTADRSESFVSDAHGRDHVTKASWRRQDGKFLAMRVTTTANMGGIFRPSPRASRPFSTRRCSPGSTRRR